MIRLIPVGLLVLGLCAPAMASGLFTIDEDTIIGESHPANDLSVSVVSSATDDVTLRLIEGGSIRSLSVGGHSTAILDGGTVTSRLFGSGDAAIVLLRGRATCAIDACGWLEGSYASFEDRSRLIVYGAAGVDDATGLESVSLRDESQAIFFGYEFNTEPLGHQGWKVSGVLLDGEPFSVRLEYLDDPAGRLILNIVPEPSSAALLAALLSFATLRRRN